MEKNPKTLVGLALVGLGVLLYLLAVGGVFQAAAPPADVGLLATVGTIVLMGVGAIWVGNARPA